MDVSPRDTNRPRGRAVPRPGVGEGPCFVGRDPELRQLMAMLAAAAAGEGHLALIGGPAGIGKTRLAEELAAGARRRGARVGIGRCWQDGEAPPLWPWRSILRDLEAPASLLDDHSAGAAHGRFARFVTVLDHLRSAAARTPLVAVVDDAHLADAASLLLVRFLAREGRGLPLLLLLTLRDDAPAAPAETRDLLAELVRQATAVPLTGLSEDAVSAYITAAGAPPLEPELLRAVTAITRGNPLHLRSMTTRSGLGSAGVLGGLDRAIEGLLEDLSGDQRRLIALAALLGPEVSVHEVARVADVPPTLAADALARAAALGLATERPGGRFGFVHELLQRSALTSLAVADRLDAHARAATLLTGPEPDRLLRRAHHAFAAASRSREDAGSAVETAREVAHSLRGVDGFESAAALLERAVEIHSAAALAAPAATLAVERAEAVLSCGRLAEARPLFQHAARVAESEHDPAALARAALGLGGVWVREHRLADEAERVLALQRRALQALPAEADVPRARLAVRLAAEDVYRGASVGPVLASVEDARKTGDARALAEALSLCHHVLMTPEHSWRRPAVASELITTAATAGDGLLALIGLCWRAADLFLLGDPGASGALAELRLRADALGCRSILFMARVMDVMLAIRAGQFARAEAAAAACLELGMQVGDADALAYHAAHLTAIRSFQGREAELADLAASIAASPTVIEEGARTFALAAALFALRGGRPEPARATLERLSRDGLASVPASSSWLITMLVVVELAGELDDARTAQHAYDALAPYAELPVMASLAVVCFGSVHRALGLAALTTGKLDLAIEHLAAAISADERLGHRPAAIQAQAELALAHLRRERGDDAQHGGRLLDEAIAAGEAAGMDGLVARWQAARASLGATKTRPEVHTARITLAENNRWRVAVDGEVATVADLIGVRYLARLVAAPDQGIPALALVVDGAHPGVGPPEAVMDRKALAAVRQRIHEIERQPVASRAEQDELAALRLQLRQAIGLGGRIRSFINVPERARTAVKKAITRAMAEIAAANPAVSEHLARRVKTGSTCRYRSDGRPGPRAARRR